MGGKGSGRKPSKETMKKRDDDAVQKLFVGSAKEFSPLVAGKRDKEKKGKGNGE